MSKAEQLEAVVAAFTQLHTIIQTWITDAEAERERYGYNPETEDLAHSEDWEAFDRVSGRLEELYEVAALMQITAHTIQQITHE